MTSVSVMAKRCVPGSGRSGYSSSGEAGGYFSLRAATTSSVGEMMLSEVVRRRRAAQMSPSAHFLWTCLERAFMSLLLAAPALLSVEISLEVGGSVGSASGLRNMKV